MTPLKLTFSAATATTLLAMSVQASAQSRPSSLEAVSQENVCILRGRFEPNTMLVITQDRSQLEDDIVDLGIGSPDWASLESGTSILLRFRSQSGEHFDAFFRVNRLSSLPVLHTTIGEPILAQVLNRRTSTVEILRDDVSIAHVTLGIFTARAMQEFDECQSSLAHQSREEGYLRYEERQRGRDPFADDMR